MGFHHQKIEIIEFIFLLLISSFHDDSFYLYIHHYANKVNGFQFKYLNLLKEYLFFFIIKLFYHFQ